MRIITLLVTTALLSTTNAVAQDRPVNLDSVLTELRQLRERVDSLEAELNRTRGAPGREEELSELDAIRAAARAAADSAQPARAGEPEAFVDRSRNLNRLNPEISVTGDVRALVVSPGPQADNIDLREFEFSFQSALDPFASTKIFLSFEDGEIDLEEAYAYWTGLPGNLRLDFGRMRQQIGELNRWHQHALPETEYPLVISTYFGEEGLIGNGVGLYWLAPTSGNFSTHEFWAQVTLGENEVLFEDSDRLSILGHLNNFFQLNRSTFFQLGGTALYGKNPSRSVETSVFGGDFRITWQPPDRAMRRSFTLRGEGYAVRKRVLGFGDTRLGGFVSAQYQLGRQLFAGLRYDVVEPLFGPEDPERILVPHLQWWQSEWVYLKAEWQHRSTPANLGLRETDDRFVLQVVWAIGPHKHETY